MAKEETVNVADERNKALKLAIEKIEKSGGKVIIHERKKYIREKK